MQGFWQKRGFTRKQLIAGLTALMVFALMAPTAAATSMVAQLEPDDESETESEAVASPPSLSIARIVFLEENLYLGTAPAGLVQDEADATSDAMTRGEMNFIEENTELGLNEINETDESEVDEDEDDDDSDSVDATLPLPSEGDSSGNY